MPGREPLNSELPRRPDVRQLHNEGRFLSMNSFKRDRKTRWGLLVVLVAASLWGPALAVAQTQAEFNTILRKHVGLTDQDFENMRNGEVVGYLLETPVKNEVAIFGVVWIDAPMDFFLAKYEDIENFEKGTGVLKTYKVSDPPTPEDFSDLALPEKDLNDLQKCKVGHCQIKVGETALARIQKEVDWSASDAHEQATKIIRELALGYVNAYQKGGNSALAVYRDKKRPTYIATEFAGMLKNEAYLPKFIPEFHQYLLEYPKAELPHSKQFVYWTENVFGLKPIVRINHVVIYHDPELNRYAIASKQLYATHYFHTALELRFLIPDPANPERKGFYYVTVNRSRSDGLTGFTGSLIRGTVKKRSLKGQVNYLAGSKKKLEEAYQQEKK